MAVSEHTNPMAKNAIMHLPADLRRASHRLISLARASHHRGRSDPLTAALSALAHQDAELLASERQWWDAASAALLPKLVQVVGASRAQQVAAAMNEIAVELTGATGEALGDEFARELVGRGAVTRAEYEELDRHNKLQLNRGLNPLTQIVHAIWPLLEADGIVNGTMPAIIKLGAQDD